ncbi:MAG TPA: cytochrome P450 [Methylomirabilota bacterium]|nr:cytochrome P450 [Methylomirabilota bacterium]
MIWDVSLDLFYPDRWTKEAKLQLPRFSYFPFGGGIRGCIGEPFAWMEGMLLLATVCQKWKMHHDQDHKVELKPLSHYAQNMECVRN